MTASPTLTPSDQDKIWTAVEGFASCMLATTDGSEIRARPMSPIIRAREGVIYFIADRAGLKDDEIRAHPAVCLAFEAGSTQVSLSGNAMIVEDRELIKAIWSTMAQAFFPNGPSDPNVLVIAVAPSHGEMWQGQNFAKTMFKVAAALATGNRAEIGQNTRATL